MEKKLINNSLVLKEALSIPSCVNKFINNDLSFPSILNSSTAKSFTFCPKDNLLYDLGYGKSK